MPNVDGILDDIIKLFTISIRKDGDSVTQIHQNHQNEWRIYEFIYVYIINEQFTVFK